MKSLITTAIASLILAASTPAAAFDTQSVDGKIVARHGNTLTVWDQRSHFTIQLTGETYVANDSSVSTASGLAEGQRVQIVFNNTDEGLFALVVNISDKPMLVGDFSKP